MPEEERPREKLLQKGVKALSDSELLAVLLRTGRSGISAVQLADQVLTLRPQGLGYLAECLPEELQSVSGIGQAKACQIVAALELGRRIATAPREKRPRIQSSDEAASLVMEDMRYLPQETFRALLLNVRGQVISQSQISVGTLNMSMANPREVFRDAVRKNAAAVIVVHNHPSGDPAPSREDIQTTRRLAETGEILGIPLWDHVIIGDGIYVSLREEGYFGKEDENRT